MKSQYCNHRITLLKTKVCFVANCMEATDPHRDKHTFVIAQVCAYSGKAEENGWVLLACGWVYQDKDQIVAISRQTSLTVTCVLRQPHPAVSRGAVQSEARMPGLCVSLCGSHAGVRSLSLLRVFCGFRCQYFRDALPPLSEKGLSCISTPGNKTHRNH